MAVATTAFVHTAKTHPSFENPQTSCLGKVDAKLRWSKANHPCGTILGTGCTMTVCAIAAKRRQHCRGKQFARKAWKVSVDLPVPNPSDLQATTSAVADELYADVAGELVSFITSTSAQLRSQSLPFVVPAVPEIPPELDSALRSQLRSLEKFLPALSGLEKELNAFLSHPELWEPALLPAGVGAALVWLLALKRGPQPWLDELPREYDYGRIAAYWQRRPLQLISRYVEAGFKVGGFVLNIYIDEWTGNLDKMRPERAVQARELITDLGVTFIKIAQVWASRPDVLPKEYLKEYEKLLEQVRPFGKDLALETLRRSVGGEKAAIDMFSDVSVFEKPIASASVGQVYKASLGGKAVAVKVQRPDVREQSTLDLYVIRSAGSLGAFLPIQRVSEQSQSLVSLIDLTSPTFIQELDYDQEAENQRRFAETVQNCDLISDTVVVPEVIFSNREVLVQEWLDGKKLTEPGAAQEQAGRVVKLLLNAYMVQFLETGFLHGDPHPGNFILMEDGKLGILDYGLMTTISSEKRLSFIEFIMHLQARDYKYCLQDLINLEFFPQALAEDQQALDVIVPALASTLGTLFEEGGDLKRKAEMFKKQREEAKNSGKLEGLREQLQAISKKYSGAFRLPPYFTLIIRAFGTLEGLGLKSDEDFAIVKECFPYISRRLITDDSFRVREALKTYLYRGRKRISIKRIDDLATGFGNFTNLMKGSRDSVTGAGGPTASAEPVRHASDSAPAVDSATRDIISVLFSPEGNFLQDLLIDEGVAAIDALSRASLVRLLQSLGPLALPISAPLSFLFGGSGDSSTLLTRQDKEALLLIRRIVKLTEGASASSVKSQGDADGTAGQTSADIAQTAESLLRLQPLAAGLLPSIAPGVASFAQRFVQRLVKGLLLRIADDVERRGSKAAFSGSAEQLPADDAQRRGSSTVSVANAA